MAKMVMASRAVYWRQCAACWLAGFFLYRILEKFVSQHGLDMVAAVLAISVFVLIFTRTMSGQPTFIDHDKDQAALIERLSAFLKRHNLWDQFIAEDAQGKGRG